MYRRFGVDFVNQLDGVFAFVLLDRTKEAIYVARDTFGVRPLFCLTSCGLIGFASEMKMLVGINELVEINVFPPGTYSKLVYQKDAVQKKLLMRKKVSSHWQEKIINKVFSSINNCPINNYLNTEETIFQLIRGSLRSADSKRIFNCKARPIACLLFSLELLWL